MSIVIPKYWISNILYLFNLLGALAKGKLGAALAAPLIIMLYLCLELPALIFL